LQQNSSPISCEFFSCKPILALLEKDMKEYVPVVVIDLYVMLVTLKKWLLQSIESDD
jgi:hypothetical protein